MQIAEDAGFFPSVFATTRTRCSRSARQESSGPATRSRYTMPGPNGVTNVLVQDLYPYAKPTPVTYMASGPALLRHREDRRRLVRRLDGAEGRARRRRPAGEPTGTPVARRSPGPRSRSPRQRIARGRCGSRSDPRRAEAVAGRAARDDLIGRGTQPSDTRMACPARPIGWAGGTPLGSPVGPDPRQAGARPRRLRPRPDRRDPRRRADLPSRLRARRPAVRDPDAARADRRPALRARLGREPDAAGARRGHPRLRHRDAARRHRARAFGVRALDELPLRGRARHGDPGRRSRREVRRARGVHREAAAGTLGRRHGRRPARS